MIPFFSIFIGLTVIAAISPLLTFVTLFQQKEWRLDRLLEHLRREGVIRQLWGTVRPLLAIACLVTDFGGFWLIFHAGSEEEAITIIPPLFLIHGFWLMMLAGYAVLQICMRRQRFPVRTSKAIAIGTASFLITLILSIITGPFLLFSPIILLLQPLIVFIVWLLFLPLDRFLKYKHFARATAIRDSWENATVIGIAGSVGKTTTKELLKHLLSDLSPIATPEHVNTEMGVAQWMQREQSAMREKSIVIVEMGAYRTGEIALMCSFARPTIGVMTALGSDHLALFGSEQAIIDANAELLQALPTDGIAFLYADNDSSRMLAEHTVCTTVLVGEHLDATVRAENIEQTDAGLRLTIKNTASTIALHGLHNVGNILLAVAVARHLGITEQRIHTLLESFHPLLHTFHVRHEAGILLVDDTYNSSRLSIRAALEWAQNKTERPRVLLLSGLLETGSAEDRFMEELGTLAAESIERVIFTTAAGQKIFEKAYGKPVELLSSHPAKSTPGSLLLCLGRMPLSFIQRFLP